MSAIPALTLAEITERGLDPAFKLLPPKMDTPEARVQLLAVALQESGLRSRRQLIAVTTDKQTGHQVLKPLGAAKSFWMGEKLGGMVKGVRLHPATAELAAHLYAERHVRRLDATIWNAIENDDVLAAGLARLLLYTDPQPLPKLGDAEGAWAYYVRCWRPGKPRPKDWPDNYNRSLEFVRGQEA